MAKSVYDSDDDLPYGKGQEAEEDDGRQERHDTQSLEEDVTRAAEDLERVERDEAREERRERRRHSQRDEQGEGGGARGGGGYPDTFGYGRRRRDRDLEELDRLHCRAVGDQKRYEYESSAAVEPAMRTREDQYKTSQTAYLNARQTAQQQVKDARTEIAKLIDQLRCMIGGDQAKLDQAWHEVRLRLQRCTGTPHSCLSDEDCYFQTDVDEVPTAQLRARQQDYDQRVTRAEALFDALIGEPTALAARVSTLQSEVTALVTETDSTTADHRLTYAKALVANFHATDEQIWLGFPIVNLYDDCLRKCLRCSIVGRRALTVIIGELAIRDCFQAKDKARCDWLVGHLAEEIFAEADELNERERRLARHD